MVRTYLKYSKVCDAGSLHTPQCQNAIFVQRRFNGTQRDAFVVASLRTLHFVDVARGNIYYSFELEQENLFENGVIGALSTYQAGKYIGLGMTTGGAVFLTIRDGEYTECMSATAHRPNTRVNVIEFSNCGAFAVSGGADTHVVIWDMVGEEPVVRLQGHSGGITGVHFLDKEGLPDGSFLASTSSDGLLKVWDIRVMACIQTLVLTDVLHMVTCSIYLSGLGCIVVGTKDDQIRVYGVNEAEKAHTLEVSHVHNIQRKSKKTVVALHLMYDETFTIHVQTNDKITEVITTLSDKKVRKRNRTDATSGLKWHGYYHTRSKNASLALLRDNRVVSVLTSNQVDILHLDSLEEGGRFQTSTLRTLSQHGHSGDVKGIYPGKDDIVTVGPDGFRTWVLSAERTLQCTGSVDRAGLTCAVRLKKDNFSPHIIGATSSGELCHVYIPELSERSHVQAHDGKEVTCICVTMDNTLYTGGKDSTLRTWKIKKGWKISEEVDAVHTLGDIPLALTISRDENFLLIALQDCTVQVLFRDTRKTFLNLYGHKFPVLGVDISGVG